jgi:Protein of unknown function (DUF2804)
MCGRRPLKQWRYVGIYGEDFMVCAGAVRVAGIPQSFWAVWDRQRHGLSGRTLMVRTGRVSVSPNSVTVRDGDSSLELDVSPSGEVVEVLSPHGPSYIWTRKTPVTATGFFAVGDDRRPITGSGIVDESAGYHARETAWEWSAGAGMSSSGEPVVWNLVRGVHDAPSMSERTVWSAGTASEVPRVRFASGLEEVRCEDGSVLVFAEEARRSRNDKLGPIRSTYLQPFGRFEGTLPGGVELSSSAPAFGVMERHRASW